MAVGQLTLRDYQQQDCDAVFSAWNESPRVVGVAATGLGKTVLIAEIAKRWPSFRGRIVVVEPTVALVDQTAQAIGRHLGEPVGIEQGTRSDSARGRLWRSRVVVASVASLSRLGRLQGYSDTEVGLVVCDEGHHGTARTWVRIIGYFSGNPDLRVLYVTATPQRGDGVGLSKVASAVAFNRSLSWAIGNGWLVRPRGQFLRVQGVSFDSLTVGKNGDFSDADVARAWGVVDRTTATPEELATAAEEEQKLHEVAAPLVQIAAGRRGIVFCATKAHARAMAEILRRYDSAAGVVIEDTPFPERERMFADYRAGRLQWLVGVAALAEGFDAPMTEIVVILRVTKSVSLLTQMVGRATRTLPGTVDGLATPEERLAAIAASKKPYCLVVDCVGATGGHIGANVTDILGAEIPDDYRQQVLDELAKAEGDYDPAEVLAEISRRSEEAATRRAEQETQRKLQRAARIAEQWAADVRQRRLRGLRARVDFAVEEVDVLEPDGSFRANTHAPGRRGTITDRQIGALCRLGKTRDEVVGWSFDQATRAMKSLLGRQGGDYVLPFGKFAGKALRDVPEWWVKWARDKLPPSKTRDSILTNYDIHKEQQRGKTGN